jgi:TPR repeat protein
MEGKGVLHNFSLAVGWYERAADAGHAEGQYKLATMYLTGQVVPLNLERGQELLERAAEQGHRKARQRLRLLGIEPPPIKAKKAGKAVTVGLPSAAVAGFDEGLDAVKRGDYAAALKVFRVLAEQGDAKAQNGLGVMYTKGHGVKKDYKEVVKWYRMAAERGYASAQDNLGVMYHKGIYIAQDYNEALKWYRKAAEQGYAKAQHNLGMMYRIGQGVARDQKEAVKWYRKAAEKGIAKAQKNLGVMYGKGRGVTNTTEH